MTQNTGGPAFPTEHTDTSGLCDGMTLRDYFAAKAMQGLVANPQHSNIRRYELAIYANFAYAMADTMLKAREE